MRAAASGKANERAFCEQLRRLRYLGEAMGVADPAGTQKNAPDTVLTLPGVHRPLVFELKENRASEGGGSNLVFREGRYERPKHPVVDRYYPAGFQPWEGRAPSCLRGDKSLETWEREKDSFPGLWLDMPNSVVSEYYRTKGADYIHVRGKGIYHTGIDPMGWGVPMFTPPCRLRIRAKQHHGSSVPNDVQVCFVFKSQALETSRYDFMDLGRLPPGFAAE
jgi:hypothetical protein